jgi:hypothetical protein
VYIGPPIDDPDILDRLPAAYRDFLARTNGYVAYGGGLHVRGACHAPGWHSLRAAWACRERLDFSPTWPARSMRQRVHEPTQEAPRALSTRGFNYH